MVRLTPKDSKRKNFPSERFAAINFVNSLSTLLELLGIGGTVKRDSERRTGGERVSERERNRESLAT